MHSRQIKNLPFYVSILAILTAVFDVGFIQNKFVLNFLDHLYMLFLTLTILGIPLKYLLFFSGRQRLRLWLIDGFLWSLMVMIFISRGGFLTEYIEISNILVNKMSLFFVFFFYFLREISNLNLDLRYRKTNPALIFVLSFGGLIILGTFLLLLPRSTQHGIGITDALFTSTSAVCVTGLVVVDTGTFFTQFGQIIILLLIQLGGIGIMTFTSFFAFFFKGGSSYQNLILLGNMTNEERISEVFRTLFKIVFFTFFLELIGAVLIYLSLDNSVISNQEDKLFFSIFHSISAFCNAGFSTLSQGLYDLGFRYNYILQIVIVFLIILGGLGFPVIINFYTFTKYSLKGRMSFLSKNKTPKYQAHLVSLNTKLVLFTTLALIIIGSLLFYILEFHNTLSEHHGLGKVVTALFGAVTPRTAGFNTVDTGSLHITTFFMLIVLMWIGASPGSTGGGIKTSTFALSFLNAISLANGRNRLEIAQRQVPELSINRAYAFIFLSLIIIGTTIFLLLLTEPDKNFTDIIFETFSAFSTVGLSRGITADLSQAGRYIIILAMFIGRVGALTLLVAFFRNPRSVIYQYPSEEILIN